MVVPTAWTKLPIEQWQGPIVLVGQPDTGKSTLGRYLYGRLLEHGLRPAYLDADVGQNDIGPPAAIAIALPADQGTTFPPAGERRLYFTGSNSPRYGRLSLLLGLQRLCQWGGQHGCQTIVVNTSGFVTAEGGGQSMKWMKIELLRPCTVIAIQRGRELEPLLDPLRRLPGVILHELAVTSAVQPRSNAQRRQRRAQTYRRYFEPAHHLPIPYNNLAVFPSPDFQPGQLVGLDDAEGLTAALGLVEKVDPGIVRLRTPLPTLATVASIRLSHMRLDLATYQDSHLD